LVLDKGRCIFFGKTKEAKPYFERLGFQCEDRKSTPDFLTGLTNPQERKIRPGAENVPTNSVDLEDAYKRSPEHERAMQEMREYEQEQKEDVRFPSPLSRLLARMFRLTLLPMYTHFDKRVPSQTLKPSSRPKRASARARDQSTPPRFGSRSARWSPARPPCGGVTNLEFSRGISL
jgi:hypothetical protein